MTTYTAGPIEPPVLKELRASDDAGRRTVPVTDEDGGAPLRCCLRHSEPGERIALVSYAPLRPCAPAPLGGADGRGSGRLRRTGAGLHPRRGVCGAGRGVARKGRC